MGSRFSNYRCCNNNVIVLNILIGIASFLLYLINKHYLRMVFYYPFFRFYFNDVLAGIVILAYSNIVISLSNVKFNLYSLKNIIVFNLVIGLFWEYVTPLYYSKSTGDPLDVVAYVVGGIVYYLIIKISNKYREK